MKRNFLGKGLAFPFRINNRGNLSLSEGDRSIEESIRILIGTAPGERVMRPKFGCRVHELVFAPNNQNTASMASFYVQEALVKWEPRILQVQVDAQPDSMNDNALQIDIRYRVIVTNAVGNLVFPFYLRKEEVL